MKRKSPGKQSPAKKTRRLQLIGVTIVGLLALCAGWYALVTRIHYDQKVAQEALTYARIETYVNTAKVYLEQELPDGGWEIEKYCEKPGSKGTIDEYSYECYYGVVSSQDLGDTGGLKQIAQKITHNTDLHIGTSQSTFLLDTKVSEVPKSCGFISWEENGMRLASIGCAANTFILKYDLRAQ